MICIFFELPYQRQVKKLFNIKFSDFLDEVMRLCSTNGGSCFSDGSKYFFCFDSSSIAYEFSSVRFLFLLKSFLEKNISLIETYRIIIDVLAENFSTQEIKNHFDKTKTILLDENSFYSTKLIYQKLSGYVNFETNGKGIYKITDFVVFNSMNANIEEQEKVESIVLHKNDTFFWAIYNFILQHPIDEADLAFLTKDERYTFSEVKNCTVFFRRHRFEKQFPEYFIDAFFMYASLYFKVYKKKHREKLPIIYSGDLRNEKLNAEIEKIHSVIPGVEVKELSKKLPDISKVHDDMLGLIFLTTIFSSYLFVDELSEFFTSLNKASDFFTDVYLWLYTNGIIFEQNNLYAHSTHLSDFVESKIGNKTIDIYRRLSFFLVSKYNEGSLRASNEFFDVLKYLGYDETDSLVLANFFHEHSMQGIVNENIEKKFTSSNFLSALEYYQKACAFLQDYKYEKSLHEIKRSIDEFKYLKLLSGEYKCMFFLGLLSLRQEQLNDAINYFAYALDIANKIKDVEFLCEVVFFASVTHFLKNDLTLALNTVKKLESFIENDFALNWKVKYLFLKGRIYAQMGEYQIAEEIFSSITNFSKQYFPEYVDMCEIWYARMLHFTGKRSEAKKIFKDKLEVHPDATLFYLESLFTTPILKDDSQEVFNTDVSNLSSDEVLKLLHTKTQENASLISGYTFIEDILLKSHTDPCTSDKLIKIFFLYHRCKVLLLNILNPEMRQKCEAFFKEMLTFSNKAVSEKNIYAHLFFFFCYDISVKLNGETSAETISYLSKCFKLLQSKVMVTGDNDIRDNYMKKNFWNVKILTSAKNQKLL